MHPGAVEKEGSCCPVHLLMGRHHRLARAEAREVSRDDMPDREPNEVLGLAHAGPDTRVAYGPPDRRARETEVVPMKLRGERHAAMDSAAEQAESTRRLAVHHVEGIGGMERSKVAADSLSQSRLRVGRPGFLDGTLPKCQVPPRCVVSASPSRCFGAMASTSWPASTSPRQRSAAWPCIPPMPWA